MEKMKSRYWLVKISDDISEVFTTNILMIPNKPQMMNKFDIMISCRLNIDTFLYDFEYKYFYLVHQMANIVTGAQYLSQQFRNQSTKIRYNDHHYLP